MAAISFLHSVLTSPERSSVAQVWISFPQSRSRCVGRAQPGADGQYPALPATHQTKCHIVSYWHTITTHLKSESNIAVDNWQYGSYWQNLKQVELFYKANSTWAIWHPLHFKSHPPEVVLVSSVWVSQSYSRHIFQKDQKTCEKRNTSCPESNETLIECRL